MDIKEKVLNNRKNGMAMMLLFIIFMQQLQASCLSVRLLS